MNISGDNFSNHNLPTGAKVEWVCFDAFNNVNLYTQGGNGDEVAIDSRDLEV